MKSNTIGLETSERETIIDFYNRGASKSNISSILNVPVKRIKNIIRCWKTTGTVHDGRRTNGRPSKLTEEQMEEVRKNLIRTGGLISGKALSEIINVNVSERTLRRLKKSFIEQDQDLMKAYKLSKSMRLAGRGVGPKGGRDTKGKVREVNVIIQSREYSPESSQACESENQVSSSEETEEYEILTTAFSENSDNND